MEKKLTLAANIAIIVVAIVAVVGVIRNLSARGASQDTQSEGPRVLLGRQFPVAHPWASNRRTVVLVLSVGCRYCSASAPFYQRLMKHAKEHQAGVVALLPQSNEEAVGYLKGLGLSIPSAGEVDFNRINVRGTPTLFVVDNRGVVQDVLQGELDETREQKIFSEIG